MTRTRKIARPIVCSPAWRQAFERLDEALEQNTQSDNSDNSEKIQQLGRHMFGDLWREPEQINTHVLTK